MSRACTASGTALDVRANALEPCDRHLLEHSVKCVHLAARISLVGGDPAMAMQGLSTYIPCLSSAALDLFTDWWLYQTGRRP